MVSAACADALALTGNCVFSQACAAARNPASQGVRNTTPSSCPGGVLLHPTVSGPKQTRALKSSLDMHKPYENPTGTASACSVTLKVWTAA